MTTAATLAGWAAAGIAAVITLAVRRVLDSRMEAVARACHELRGPITAARLGLSFGERTGELSPDRLRAIDTELGRASLALQDLADAGRGGPRLAELQRVDLEALMSDCVRGALGLAAEHGTRIDSDWRGRAAVVVWGNRLRLAQALGNLIANAIEHGGSTVSIRAIVGDDVIRLEVSDDGPGLPAPVAELVRHPRRGRGARGRGLAIAATIASAHGGRVAAAPATRGCRIALELPLAPAPPDSPRDLAPD